MAGLLTVIGLLVICATLREIFRDLFHPSGSGALSSFTGRTLFAIARRLQWMLPVAGPLTIFVVISLWSSLLIVGFGLIYWPHFPYEFYQPVQEGASASARLWSVLYFSMVSLTTLASGGLAPQAPWIRICTAVESLIGIGLVTASVTWIVLIYPALGRMRAIGRRLSVLRRAREKTGTDLFPVMQEALLNEFARRIVRLRIDFIHFPLIYYFHADTEGASLAYSLRTLLEVAREGSTQDKKPQIRLAAAMLEMALYDVAKILTLKFVRGSDSHKPQEVFDAVAADHLNRDEDESAG